MAAVKKGGGGGGGGGQEKKVQCLSVRTLPCTIAAASFTLSKPASEGERNFRKDGTGERERGNKK